MAACSHKRAAKAALPLRRNVENAIDRGCLKRGGRGRPGQNGQEQRQHGPHACRGGSQQPRRVVWAPTTSQLPPRCELAQHAPNRFLPGQWPPAGNSCPKECHTPTENINHELSTAFLPVPGSRRGRDRPPQGPLAAAVVATAAAALPKPLRRQPALSVLAQVHRPQAAPLVGGRYRQRAAA